MTTDRVMPDTFSVSVFNSWHFSSTDTEIYVCLLKLRVLHMQYVILKILLHCMKLFNDISGHFKRSKRSNFHF